MSGQEQPSCPVDPSARDAWLRAAAQSTSAQPPHPIPHSPSQSQTGTPASVPFARPKFTNTRTPQLSQDRQTSSIPRSLPSAPTDISGQPHDRNALIQHGDSSPNAQSENPITSLEGNWIYPSEHQFHSALVRKHGASNAPAEDMIPSIIPIHNAVNERTWKEILDWERVSARPVTAVSVDPREDTKAAMQAAAPQLVSFKGDSQKLTPRARFRGWIGYQAPFDRHDWIVRRLNGEQVEYVIDFYAGKSVPGAGGNMPLSFYLDVRPKLNSFEGCRMRFAKFWGW